MLAILSSAAFLLLLAGALVEIAHSLIGRREAIVRALRGRSYPAPRPAAILIRENRYVRPMAVRTAAPVRQPMRAAA